MIPLGTTNLVMCAMRDSSRRQVFSVGDVSIRCRLRFTQL